MYIIIDDSNRCRLRSDCASAIPADCALADGQTAPGLHRTAGALRCSTFAPKPPDPQPPTLLEACRKLPQWLRYHAEGCMRGHAAASEAVSLADAIEAALAAEPEGQPCEGCVKLDDRLARVAQMAEEVQGRAARIVATCDE